jgi:hypothetical protein
MELKSINSSNTNNEQIFEYPHSLVSENIFRDLGVLALICALEEKENNDYASGAEYPNIPFGD